jgi:YVTN family beta-propeller protein
MSGDTCTSLLSRRAMLGRSAAVALTVPAGLAAAPVASRGFVYTANEKGNSISVVDLAAMRVTTVPVAISPHNVQASADGRWLLAVGDPASAEHGHEAAEHGAGKLLVFATDDLAHGPIQEIEIGRHPAHVVADRTAMYAFVTLAGEDAVAAVDLHRELILGRIGTGRYPHGLRISPDGREIYVANVKDGSVSVLDPAGLRELERVPVGEEPIQVGFARDGVYVSLRGENRVAVIDPALRRVVAKIPVGRGPVQVYPTPDGRYVYAANQGTDASPDHTVSVITTADRRVAATVRTGEGAHGVVVSDDGAWAFVTNVADGTLTIIDTAANAAVASLPVGPGPNGVTFRALPPSGP